MSVAAPGQGGISLETANVLTILLLGVGVIGCLVLRFNADSWSWSYYGYNVTLCSGNVSASGGGWAYCQGDAAVLRASAGLEVYFCAMGALCLVCLGSKAHRGFWCWKVLGAAALFIGFLFLPASAFSITGYVWTARVFSFVYLIVQLVLMLGFAYDWNDKWVDNAYRVGVSRRVEHAWLALVLGSALVLLAGSLVGLGFQYAYYPCALARGVTTVTLIAVLLFVAVALFRDKLTGVEGAVLPAAVMAAYITYLSWSALDSNSDAACKPYAQSASPGPNATAVMWAGIFIVALSTMWLAGATAKAARSIVRGGKAHGPAAAAAASDSVPLVYEVGGGRTAEDLRREQDQERAQPAPEPARAACLQEGFECLIFYTVMLLTTMYMSMVLTEWGAGVVENASQGLFWVKVVSQWLCILLMLWTQLAPAILTNRDFGSQAPVRSAPSGSAASAAAAPKSARPPTAARAPRKPQAAPTTSNTLSMVTV